MSLIMYLVASALAAAGAALPLDWQGYYVNERNTAEIVVAGATAWVLTSRPIASPFVVDKLGVTLAPAGAKLTRVDGTWRLTIRDEFGDPTDNTTLVQRPDALLAAIRRQLAGEKQFVLLDAHGKRTRAKLTLKDGLAAAVESPDKSGVIQCYAALLRHEPSRRTSEESETPPPPDQPKPGTIAWRQFMLLRRHVGTCHAPLAASDEIRGLLAGAKLYAKADGRVLAIQLSGYMFGALYVADGLSPAVLEKLQRGLEEDLMRQAE